MRVRRVFAVGISVVLMCWGLGASPAWADLPLPTLGVPGSLPVAINTATAVSGITVNDDGLGSVQVEMTVNHGTLSMSTTTGLAFASGWGNGTSAVQFTATTTNAQNALNTLTFTPTNSYTGAATITYNTTPTGGGSYNPTNGHFYKVVVPEFGDPYPWTNSLSAASSSTFYGFQGYLATVTSASEQAFVKPLLGSIGRTWIAGTDSSDEGTSLYNWIWAVGPEDSTEFWQGEYDQYGDGTCDTAPDVLCQSVDGQYNNWAPIRQQPNNQLRNSEEPELYTSVINSTGYWDDLQNFGSVSQYLLEYGGMEGDPGSSVVDTETTNITVAATAPSVPTSLQLTAGNAQVGVSWAAPSSTGGSSIDNYLVEWSSNSGTNWTSLPTTTLTSATITGLTNGTPIMVRVSAHNSIGYGPTTDPATATPATTSSAPQSLAASVANTQTVVTWTAPTSNGGASITGYKVEYSSNGGDTYSTFSTSTTSPATITGLTNGTTYTIRVTPINSVGLGTAATTTVIPGTAPGIPSTPVLTVGNGQLGVQWNAPITTGGHPIDNYVVEYSIDNGDDWIPTTATSSTSMTITGLTNGVATLVRVEAHNDIGYGSHSSNASATPATTASAPQSPSAVGSNGQVQVSWSTPASNGGASITGYKVEYSSNGGNTYSTFSASTSSPATITSLTNGTLYRIKISAINSVGVGAPVTIDQTAGAVASAPRNLVATAGPTQAVLSWDTPTSDGGLTITGYRVEYSIDGSNWTVATSTTTSPYTLTGLTNGTLYHVRVSAITQLGAGSSTASTVTPLGPASMPQNLATTHTANAAVVTWTAPSDNGGTPITSYKLEYRLANGEWTVVSNTATSPAGISVLSPGAAYEVRVTPVTEFGPGTAASTTFTTDVPPAPGVSAPIHISPEGTITTVPVFDTNTPAPVVASTPSGDGSWALTPDGGVFTAGDAPFFGSMGAQPLAAPAVGIAPTATGDGYYIVGADGGVFAFGDAQFQGSMGGAPLNAPITGIAPSCNSTGYYLVAGDGGVFAFGSVGFYGSMGGHALNQGMIGVVDACGKHGYWTYAADGGVFSFGDAQFYGSLGNNPPPGGVIGMVSAPDGEGYWLIGADHKAYGFGSVK